jgi:GMP synthase PP-ATPase subunit
MNSASNWILKTGTQTIDCVSFPYAFRTAYNIIRKSIETGNETQITKTLTILGPPNVKGERRSYSYASAMRLAIEQDLLTSEGTINSKEFKKKY